MSAQDESTIELRHLREMVELQKKEIEALCWCIELEGTWINNDPMIKGILEKYKEKEVPNGSTNKTSSGS